MKKKLRLETLETREMLATLASFEAGFLSVNGDFKGNTIEVTQIDGTNSINVVADGNNLGTFDNVKSVIVNGFDGNDNVTINTNDDPAFLVNSVVYGGNGNDTIQGGGGSDSLYGGNGDDIITNFVTDDNYKPIGKGSVDYIFGGNGNDILWGGWGVTDYIFGGNGDDVIYDIVGGSNYVDGGAGRDWLVDRTGLGLPTDPLNNPGALVADSVVFDKYDESRVLFDAGTQLNGPVVINKVLYVLNLGGGNIDLSYDKRGNYLLTYNGQQFSYSRNAFNTIAGIGGGTNDTFVNNTFALSVFYGQGGDDKILGGYNKDLLKGGNGNDTIDGRGGDDIISGDAGADTLNAKYQGRDVVYYDLFDTIYTDLGDRLVKKRFKTLT